MIDPTVQAWLASKGWSMTIAAEHGDSKAMYEVICEVATEVDKYINPARLASERLTIENEGILN